jgi:hypothetical protein
MTFSKILNRVGVCTFAVFCMLGVSDASMKHSRYSGKLWVDGVENAAMTPGQPAEWKMSFHDHMTNEQVTDFMYMHGKPMHLIVVKKDFSEFAHVHPTLIGKTGMFSMIVNQVSSDPDNVAASRVINTPGDYFIYAEIFPKKGGSLTPVMEMPALSVKATGDDVVGHPLEVDVTAQDGEFVKYMNMDGTTAKYGSPLQIRMAMETSPGCNGNLIKMTFKILVWSEKQETYLRLPAVEKWLTVSGHLFLISEKGENADDKNMAHLHAAEDLTTRDLVFYHFDRNELSDGKYKMWLEFKTGGRLIAAPMVIQYTAPANTAIDCRR